MTENIPPTARDDVRQLLTDLRSYLVELARANAGADRSALDRLLSGLSERIDRMTVVGERLGFVDPTIPAAERVPTPPESVAAAAESNLSTAATQPPPAGGRAFGPDGAAIQHALHREVPAIRPASPDARPSDVVLPANLASRGVPTPSAAPPLKGTRVPAPLPAPPPSHRRIPSNGNVGKAFECDLAALTGVAAGSLALEGPLPAGLSLDERSRLVGTPTAAGEYRLRWQSRQSSLAGELLLTVNADPRSLWKNLASDTSDPYWKADSDRAERSTEVARVAVASVRGRSHAHVGSFRDDDFGLHVPVAGDPHGWHILCVADGAGSAKSSRKGSKVACEAMVGKLKELLVDAPDQAAAEFNSRSLEAVEADISDSFWHPRLYQVLATAAHHAQSAVRTEAECQKKAIKEYSTTLLATIVRRTRRGAWFVGAYWVGDGAIGMWKEGWAAPKLFGEPESGEYAGQTTFFTSEDFNRGDLIGRRLRYTLVESFDYLAMMTDGISDPKFPTEHLLKQGESWKDFSKDLDEVLSEMRAGSAETDARLLEWMDFWSAGNHDDRTLLLMVPREA
jgi:hypothetical protein